MSENKKYEIDMCNGPILKKMLIFALPLVASGMLQLLFNAVDIIVVGRYAGEESLAAVGANTSFINLLTNFFMGLSVGANILVSRYRGSGQHKDLSETVHTAMKLSLYSGVILSVVGFLGARYILQIMKTPADIIDLSAVYLRIYFLGMIATMIYNFGSAILRAVGDTRRPLYFLLLAGVINVVLNLVFVIKFHMGVAGVAVATVISQTVAAALVVLCMVRETGVVHLEIKKLRISREKFVLILKAGLPASFQSVLFSISNVTIQSSINTFGKITIAGNTAASSVEGFVYVAMNAFYQAAISFTSQNVGAGKYNRINGILWRAQLSVFAVGMILGNLVVILGEPLLRFYNNESDVIQAGLNRLNVISRTYAICGMMDVMVGMLRGLGYSVMPMLVSLVGVCGIRLLWIFTVFTIEEYRTTFSLYITYPMSWGITLAAHFVCYIIARKLINKKREVGIA